MVIALLWFYTITWLQEVNHYFDILLRALNYMFYTIRDRTFGAGVIARSLLCTWLTKFWSLGTHIVPQILSITECVANKEKIGIWHWSPPQKQQITYVYIYMHTLSWFILKNADKSYWITWDIFGWVVRF